jgi:hypothetical protein
VSRSTARSTRTTAPARRHARFADDGRLLALVADGETEAGPLDFLNVAEGQPPFTREQIAEHLAGLDPEALQAVVDAAIAEGAAIDPASVTSETIDRINALGDAREVAEERLQAIEQEEEETRTRAQEALQRLRPPAAEGEGGGEGDEENPDGENVEGTEGAEAAQTPEPVAASAPAPRRAGRRTTAIPRPGAAGGMGSGTVPPTGGTPSAYTAPRATNTLVAAAGLDAVGLGTGSTIEAPRQLGEAFGSRIDSIRRGHGSGADGEHLTVATVRTAYPEDRVLRQGAVDTNTTNVRNATSRESLVAAGQAVAATGTIVAAGGLCGPVEQLNDVPVIGSVARPVRDALANFGADRGGVKWREHLSFGDFADAIGFWSMADDEAAAAASDTDPYTGPEKPCAEVLCPDEAEAYVEAITLCLKFRNVSARFDPEGTAANISAAQIAHARVAENRLLSQIGALSTTVTGAEVLGAMRDLLTWLDQLLAQYRSFYRLDDAIALRCVLPAWVRNLLRADLTRGMAGDLDAIAVADARIAGWFQTRGVNVTWHLDGLPARVAAAGVAPAIPAQAYGAFTPAGAVAAFPASIEALLWVEGDMLHLDGGTLDLGVVRDSTLNQRNEYKTFSESWEGVAHRGVEAIRGVVTTRPLGMVSGTRDTAAILAA